MTDGPTASDLPPASARGDWTPCTDQGCGGVRADGATLCLAHLLRQDGHRPALAGGELDARGNVLEAGELTRLLQAVPRGHGGQPALVALRLDGARIAGDAELRASDISGPFSAVDVRFEGNLDARSVTVGGVCDLRRMLVAGRLDIREVRLAGAVDAGELTAGTVEAERAHFEADLNLADARIEGRSEFTMAHIGHVLTIRKACFGGESSWRETTVGAHVMGGDARFDGLVNMAAMKVAGGCHLAGARFEDALWMTGAEVGSVDLTATHVAGDLSLSVTAKSDVRLSGADLATARALGTISALHLDLSGATVQRHVEFSAKVGRLSCRETQFVGGATIRVWGVADLSGARFGAASTVSPGADFALREGEVNQVAGDLASKPRLLSVRDADVGNLALDSLDLSRARLAGAHGLDGLRIQGDYRLDEAPGFPWSRRAAVAEEHEWRARRGYSKWAVPEGLPEFVQSPSAADIASVYRGLRKGREDAKDFSGAGDLYYGEMEMRRHEGRDGSRHRARFFEHRLVFLYWLLSGYGLRATRSLALLIALIFAGGLVAQSWGFVSCRSLGQAMLWSTGSAISFGAGPNYQLTDVGSALHIALRVLGPVGLALSVLAIRGRLRR